MSRHQKRGIGRGMLGRRASDSDMQCQQIEFLDKFVTWLDAWSCTGTPSNSLTLKETFCSTTEHLDRTSKVLSAWF